MNASELVFLMDGWWLSTFLYQANDNCMLAFTTKYDPFDKKKRGPILLWRLTYNYY